MYPFFEDVIGQKTQVEFSKLCLLGLLSYQRKIDHGELKAYFGTLSRLKSPKVALSRLKSP